ncbi:MAG: urate hydroxylase PuuD [Acidobacteria bacterium]|nr:urate hydroxylase PuuD [Acidobacteriota bacterium]
MKQSWNYWSDWLNLLVRWMHVFTAILWVGQTYFFTWMDGQLSEAEAALKGSGEKAQLWMVHSGGFYVVEKQKVAELSRKLHWFRFEALLTWLSGVVLLVLVYYMSSILVDPDGPVSHRTGVLIGVGLLIFSWVIYDLLCRTPLVRQELAFAVVCYLLVVGVAYGLTRYLSGRAAYLHLGAMFGTIMVSNVWMRILPPQRKMIAAMREGRMIEESLSAGAKLRSKHNTFMVVPLIFTMLSNHFPVATNGYHWTVLAALVLCGWIAAKFIRRA